MVYVVWHRFLIYLTQSSLSLTAKTEKTNFEHPILHFDDLLYLRCLPMLPSFCMTMLFPSEQFQKTNTTFAFENTVPWHYVVPVYFILFFRN